MDATAGVKGYNHIIVRPPDPDFLPKALEGVKNFQPPLRRLDGDGVLFPTSEYPVALRRQMGKWLSRKNQ
ncbi:hypothetical protein Dda_9449 [Drechslerella dactyloides]|uniref:Uncharacterized protein n=1 Tax=Drechslerella dactyloides TaxID=74499 RepID=A0AAD6IPD2_DREDA|nr:hypothetical protein Dda_9449 [Drechslerella dactyloides]